MKKMLSVVMLVLVSMATPWHAYAQSSPAEITILKTKAATGDITAQNTLGHMYDFGTGVPQNKTEALRWYRLAAAQNDADAQTNIGDMYRRGIGISEDHTEAVKWYRLAADQGDAKANAKARNTLGDMYRLGEGVPEDLVQAYRWYTLAASAGNAYAEYSKNLVETELRRRSERHPFAERSVV